MEKKNIKEEKNELKERVEKVFMKCGLNFENVDDDFEDDDLNYFVNFDATDLVSGVGKIRAFIYFTLDKPKCSLMMGNIYKFSEENKDRALQITNKINTKLNTGRVVVSDNSEHLLFVDGRILENFNEIDEELVNSIILSAKVAIAIIYADVEAAFNEE